MPDPFTKNPEVGTPTWTSITIPDGQFAPLSSTGQTQISGGYGLGGYGGGGYGEGDGTISISTETNTIWTAYTTK